jgi:mycoredoxin
LVLGVSKMRVYTTAWCGHCRRLKAQLDRAGVDFHEVDIERDATAASFVAGVNGGNQTVPTVQLPDGSVLTNPTLDQIIAATAA